MAKIRLTVDNIQKILKNNDGFKETRSYQGANYSYTNRYEITGGKLMVAKTGKGAFGGSQYDDPSRECDIDQTRTFLRSVLDKLDTNV